MSKAKEVVLADDLRLSSDVARAVTLVAGKRGSGKTNTAKVIVEQIYKIGVPIAILDPVDVWYGLKSGRDGKAEGGLPFYVFGGKHADTTSDGTPIPLEPGGGRLMANLFIEQRISAIMVLREFSGADRARFVADFAEELLSKNTLPILLVVEEAHELMPQSPMGEEKRSKGMMLRLIKLGRSSGIAMLEMTQRLAALDKTATTQADLLVMHRTTGPQDRRSLGAWIEEHHASEEDERTFLASLPTLKTGEAWLWGPDFPEDKPIGLIRRKIAMCATFNSHATPKLGEVRAEPKLVHIDLDALHEKLSAQIERARESNPTALRKRVRELEKELDDNPELARLRRENKTMATSIARLGSRSRLAAHGPVTAASVTKLEREVDRLEKFAKVSLKGTTDELASRITQVEGIVATISGALRDFSRQAAMEFGQKAFPEPEPWKPPVVTRVEHTSSNGDDGSTGSGNKALVAIAQHADGVTRQQLTVLTGYKRSTRDKYVQLLVAAGHAEVKGNRVYATRAGIAELGPNFEPLPTGVDLQRHWLGRLDGGEKRVLAFLIKAYPNEVQREELESLGYKRSTRDKYIQLLAARELVTTTGKGVVRAADQLF